MSPDVQPGLRLLLRADGCTRPAHAWWLVGVGSICQFEFVDGCRALTRVRASVELCTIYWHFLLLVWAVLFGLLLST